VTGSAIAAPAMDDRPFTARVGGAQERQNISFEHLPRTEMVVSDRLHENAGCTEKFFVLGLEVDREAGQLLIVEKAAHSGHALTTNEVGPLYDAVQRCVRRPCPVHCPLAAPGRTKVEVRIHFLHPSWPNSRLRFSRAGYDRTRRRRLQTPVRSRDFLREKAGRLRQRLAAQSRILSSYQSLCNDDLSHRRHEVQRHWWLQPGQHPRVENVFHTIPHPSKNGSGVSTQSQHQRLESEGRQLQSGHRIPPNASSWSGPDTLTVIGSDAQSSFKSRSGTSGSSVTFILSA
jgi:hypothetical protein